MSDISIDPLSALVSGVIAWRDKKPPDTDEERGSRIEAISSVLQAAVKTKAYIYDRDVLKKEARTHEHELAHAWQEASSAIEKYDRELFKISQVKAFGWSDPREWEKRIETVATVSVDTIIEQCNHLIKS